MTAAKLRASYVYAVVLIGTAIGASIVLNLLMPGRQLEAVAIGVLVGVVLDREAGAWMWRRIRRASR